MFLTTVVPKVQRQPPGVFCKKSCCYKFCHIHRKITVLESLFNKVAVLYWNGLRIVWPLFPRLTFNSTPRTKESFPLIRLSIRSLCNLNVHLLPLWKLCLQPLHYSCCWIYYFCITEVYEYELSIHDRIVSCNVEVTLESFLYKTW